MAHAEIERLRGKLVMDVDNDNTHVLQTEVEKEENDDFLSL